MIWIILILMNPEYVIIVSYPKKLKVNFFFIWIVLNCYFIK